MDVYEIKLDVQQLELRSGDSEDAHPFEDGLYNKVLTYIAEHCTDEHCRELAQEVLKAADVEFSRWYA
jgi:hypothetical protein